MISRGAQTLGIVVFHATLRVLSAWIVADRAGIETFASCALFVDMTVRVGRAASKATASEPGPLVTSLAETHNLVVRNLARRMFPTIFELTRVSALPINTRFSQGAFEAIRASRSASPVNAFCPILAVIGVQTRLLAEAL